MMQELELGCEINWVEWEISLNAVTNLRKLSADGCEDEVVGFLLKRSHCLQEFEIIAQPEIWPLWSSKAHPFPELVNLTKLQLGNVGKVLFVCSGLFLLYTSPTLQLSNDGQCACSSIDLEDGDVHILSSPC